MKLEIGGVLGNPALDIWSNSIRFKVQDDDDPTVPSLELRYGDLVAALAFLRDPIQAWWDNTEGGIGSNAFLTYAKLNWITASGEQRDVNTNRIDWAPRSGPLGSNPSHWFVSVAQTFRTEKSRGRAHSGRIFPPCIIAPVGGTSPYITAPAAALMAANTATALDAYSSIIRVAQDNPDTQACYPVVGSPATTTGPNPGGALLQRITGVVCDRVADVQHRRTNRVPRLEGDLSPVEGAD